MGGVGREIRRRREEKGWTGAQLAVYANMSPSAVSQIETGRRSPNAASMRKLAKALEVEVADLFPKASAPLPLEFADQAGQHGQKTATETLYTGLEAFGQVLASRWSGELEAWDEKVPDGEVPGSFDFGRMFEWSLAIAHTCKHYNDLARHDGCVPRPELEDALDEMTNAAWKAGAKVKRVFESAKTSVEFQKIVRANDLEAILSSTEIDD